MRGFQEFIGCVSDEPPARARHITEKLRSTCSGRWNAMRQACKTCTVQRRILRAVDFGSLEL